MSQAEDIAAIHDYFNRTPGKTQAAKDAKESWSKWYSGLTFMQKSFSDDIMAMATRRRVDFDAANGDVKRLDDGGLTKEESEYFAKLPSANVTGMSPEDAKRTIAAAAQKGTQVPVPATLLALQVGTLRQGSKGDSVKALQTALGITADGSYGPATVAAVKKFQKANGLKEDGLAGPATFAAIGKSKPALITKVQEIVQKPYSAPVQNFDLANAVATPAPASKVSAPAPKVSAPASKVAVLAAVKPTVTAAMKPATTSTGVVATVTPSFSVPVSSRPVLRKGMSGSWVSFWQKAIEIPVTSTFDTATHNLTMAWQTNNGLVADGVVGAGTWTRLDANRPMATATQAVSKAATQTAGLIGSNLSGVPTWAKWFLAVLGVGAIGFGISQSKGSLTKTAKGY